MTKLTKKQYEHFLKGGTFTATYKPTKMDIGVDAIRVIDQPITVWPNIHMGPCDYSEYLFQLQFNTDRFDGWIPEDDLQNIEINKGQFIDVYEHEHEYFKETGEYPKAWVYKMIYHDMDGIKKDFGNYKPNQLPLVVYRSYSECKDDYVMNRLTNGTDNIEKTVWQYNKKPKWEKLELEKATS